MKDNKISAQHHEFQIKTEIEMIWQLKMEMVRGVEKDGGKKKMDEDGEDRSRRKQGQQGNFPK